jgi:hypothetical protein
LFEPGGGVFDDVKDGLAEVFDEFAGVDGSDAADHAAAEVFLDAFEGGGGCAGEDFGFELEAVFPITHPAAFGMEPFAGAD